MLETARDRITGEVCVPVDHRELLAADDLIALTGAAWSTKQAEILRAHGIFFIERLDGSPVTTWYHVNHPYHCTPREERPDFESLHG
ncbi:MAG: DUF4224 domain-containing protein [Gammaproteobacteria bacterium]